jgi:hypothetical protein
MGGGTPKQEHVFLREADNRVTVAAQSDGNLVHPPDQQYPADPDRRWGLGSHVLAPTGATFLDQSSHERREMRGQDQVILTIMGVWEDGRHQIIHYQLAAAEDTAAWSDLVAELIARGLDAGAVQFSSAMRSHTWPLPITSA